MKRYKHDSVGMDGELTAFWAARDVGPARDGIQKNPAVRSPSSATFESALQKSNS